MKIKMKIRLSAIVVSALVCFCGGFAYAAEHIYTSEQTVSETISGTDAVTVNCPSGKYVTFTGNNSYSGDTTLSSGGIVVSSLTALGAGKIKCSSGTAIRVTVDYSSAAGGLTAALIDRIEVDTAGTSDPYVSLQLTGDGLKNDVDFSGQPNLWLGAPSDRAHVFTGSFTPYANEYHLGRSGHDKSGSYVGLIMPALADAPDGTSRKAIICGNGMLGFTGTATLTGGMELRGNVGVCVSADDSLGASVTMKDGSRINATVANLSFPTDFALEGTVQFHNCGGVLPNCTEIRGSVSGSGKVRASDIGGLLFSGANNTYTGEIGAEGTHATKPIEIGFGNGANCSWCGSKVTQPSGTNLTISINCDSDVTIDTDFGSVGGRLVKRGTGIVTLGAAYKRKTIVAGVPALEIFAGAVKLMQALPAATEGLVRIAKGGALDLNGLSDVCWLPYGGGDILNPKDGHLTLRGASLPGLGFCGAVEGSVTVEEAADGVAWRLEDGCTAAGSMKLSKGDFEIAPGVALANLEVPFGMNVAFAADARQGLKGLRAELWKSPSTWRGGDIPTRFDRAKTWMADRSPDRVTDLAAYGDVFYSEESGENSPLIKMWGPEAVSDQFAARFSGYFVAQTDGEYAFKMYADDAADLYVDGVLKATSLCTDATFKMKLTASCHSIEILYCEVNQSQRLNLSYKVPDAGEYAPLPLQTLSAMPVPASSSVISHVTGAGTFSMRDGGAWPETFGLDGFNGRILVGGGTASSSVGMLTPGTADILFAGADSLAGTNWMFKGDMILTNETSGYGALLPGAQQVWGALNTAKSLSLDKPFTLSFDYETKDPANNNVGYGFGLFLHDGQTGWHNGVWNNQAGSARVGDASAYGFQNYAQNYGDYTGWIKNGDTLGTIESHNWTKGEFGLSYIKNSPMRVTLTWDLQKLVYKQTRKTYVYAATNEVAATDIPLQFPSGAYLGIWCVCKGNWTTMHISNLSLIVGTPSSSEDCILGGAITVTDGPVVAYTDGTGVTPVWKASLRVTGDGSVAPAAGTTMTCVMDSWTFDMSNPASYLTVGNGFVFQTGAAATPINVCFDGDVGLAWREIADLTAVGGSADGLAFVSPVKKPIYEFRYESRKLSVRKVIPGLMLIVR